MHEDGIAFDYLKDQAQKYASYQEECVQKGCKKPCGDGVLILDEVKVIEKVAWHSNSGQMIGLAMDQAEIPILADIGLEKENRGAQYFLQFLWRDLTSDFDVIRPHYSCDRSMNCAFTLACTIETIEAFQAYGFKVI